MWTTWPIIFLTSSDIIWECRASFVAKTPIKLATDAVETRPFVPSKATYNSYIKPSNHTPRCDAAPTMDHYIVLTVAACPTPSWSGPEWVDASLPRGTFLPASWFSPTSQWLPGPKSLAHRTAAAWSASPRRRRRYRRAVRAVCGCAESVCAFKGMRTRSARQLFQSGFDVDIKMGIQKKIKGIPPYKR